MKYNISSASSTVTNAYVLALQLVRGRALEMQAGRHPNLSIEKGGAGRFLPVCDVAATNRRTRSSGDVTLT